MTRTASYTVLILRTPIGYEALCPAFPHLAVKATSARLAYARCKAAIKARLTTLLSSHEPAPRDPVVQAKTLRIDLWYLSEQENLR